jgi:hypothetical protein
MHQGQRQDRQPDTSRQNAPLPGTTKSSSSDAQRAPATRRSRLGATFFLGSEDGAVTVDWVVLTAAIVGLGFAVIIPIGYSTESSVAELEVTISDVGTGYVTTAP